MMMMTQLLHVYYNFHELELRGPRHETQPCTTTLTDKGCSFCFTICWVWGAWTEKQHQTHNFLYSGDSYAIYAFVFSVNFFHFVNNNKKVHCYFHSSIQGDKRTCSKQGNLHYTCANRHVQGKHPTQVKLQKYSWLLSSGGQRDSGQCDTKARSLPSSRAMFKTNKR